MDILFILIPLSLVLVVLGGWAFFWAVDTGQFDDLDSPGWDALNDGVTGEDAAHRSHSRADQARRLDRT